MRTRRQSLMMEKPKASAMTQQVLDINGDYVEK